MDASALDYSDARERMVDSQLRPNRVSDPALLKAIRELPRERFLPPQLAAMAYLDEDVPLGAGRVLMEPLVIARLLQLAQVRAGEAVLVIGAGSGYAAALLAACGAAVTALEEDLALRDMARSALAAFAPSVRLVSGPLAAGWPAGAPWELILIEGAVPAIPDSIAAQLRPAAGRVVTVLVGRGRAGVAVVGELTGVGLTLRPAFDCATAVLPQFIPEPKFVF